MSLIVKDRPGLDDPIWQHVLETSLRPYIDVVREWWSKVQDFSVPDTGLTEIVDERVVGLYVRFTRVAARSPLKGIQAFPFVPTGRLQLTHIQGGSTKMITRVCMDNKLKLDEFTIVCKEHMPSVFNAAQIVAFIPTNLLDHTKALGNWLYFTAEECSLLARGQTNDSIKLKAMLKA